MDNCCTAQARRFDQATALRDDEHALGRGARVVGAKYGFYETTLTKPAVTAGKAALSFMERILAAYTVTNAAEDMAGTVIDSDYKDPSTSHSRH